MNAQGKTFVLFGLMAEFGASQVPLAVISEKYFGMSEKEASLRARSGKLPVPAFRVGTQKSQWFVSVEDLAVHISNCVKNGRLRWEANNDGEAA